MFQDNTGLYFDYVNNQLAVGNNTFLAVGNVLNAYGSNTASLQINAQNSLSGTFSSSDLVATADTGNNNVNYIDVGINSSTYNDSAFTVGNALAGYIYNLGGDLTIGTGTSAKVIKLHTGGTLLSNVRTIISDTGLATYGVLSSNDVVYASGGNSRQWNNTYTTVSTISSVWSTFNLNFIIDGAGDTITTGSKGYITVPYNATIKAWTLLADQSGSITIDVRKCSSNTFPTTTSIASPSASMTSAQISSSNSLGGWTTAINAGDILEFVVNNVTSIQRVSLALSGTKP